MTRFYNPTPPGAASSDSFQLIRSSSSSTTTKPNLDSDPQHKTKSNNNQDSDLDLHTMSNSSSMSTMSSATASCNTPFAVRIAYCVANLAVGFGAGFFFARWLRNRSLSKSTQQQEENEIEIENEQMRSRCATKTGDATTTTTTDTTITNPGAQADDTQVVELEKLNNTTNNNNKNDTEDNSAEQNDRDNKTNGKTNAMSEDEIHPATSSNDKHGESSVQDSKAESKTADFGEGKPVLHTDKEDEDTVISADTGKSKMAVTTKTSEETDVSDDKGKSTTTVMTNLPVETEHKEEDLSKDDKSNDIAIQTEIPSMNGNIVKDDVTDTNVQDLSSVTVSEKLNQGSVSMATMATTDNKGISSSSSSSVIIQSSVASASTPQTVTVKPVTRITRLIVYPIKGCSGLEVSEIDLTVTGLQGDRGMVVVDFTGRALNQKRFPVLQRTVVTYLDNGDIRLTRKASNGENENDRKLSAEFTPSNIRGQRIMVKMLNGSKLEGVDQGDHAADFFATLLEVAGVRLVQMRNGTTRNDEIDGLKYKSKFSDEFPLLVTTEPSRKQLDTWMKAENEKEADLNMDRFRPNIVVDGDELQAFEEDGWKTIKIEQDQKEGQGEEGIKISICKPCTRCKVTTVDPHTVMVHPEGEPLRTLKKHRKVGVMVHFGMNAVPLHESAQNQSTSKWDSLKKVKPIGKLRVGDVITVVERRDVVEQSNM